MRPRLLPRLPQDREDDLARYYISRPIPHLDDERRQGRLPREGPTSRQKAEDSIYMQCVSASQDPL